MMKDKIKGENEKRNRAGAPIIQLVGNNIGYLTGSRIREYHERNFFHCFLPQSLSGQTSNQCFESAAFEVSSRRIEQKHLKPQHICALELEAGTCTKEAMVYKDPSNEQRPIKNRAAPSSFSSTTSPSPSRSICPSVSPPPVACY